MPKSSAFLLGIALGFLVGWFGLMLLYGTVIDLYDSPELRHTVAELTDAIATREATFTERAIELQGEK